MLDTPHIQRLLEDIALRNSQAAYKELFLLLYKPLRQFAFSILKSHDDADEVVSDVFITLWEKRDKLTGITSPRIYIYQAVKNRALNNIAWHKRQQALDTSQWLVSLDSVYFDPEKLMMTEELIQRIRLAIQELPTRCRLIFKLVKEDGLKYREVAELLQVSVKTVEAQMAIALRRLGRCMPLDIPKSYQRPVKK